MTEQKKSENNKPAYQVLATKYRPQTFKDLIGQEVLVRTLTNAINQNRIANAFLLTGIRGIGKTTTARIIARALNCVGEDGKGSATTEPCGKCSACISIKEDRHPDVLEMDAASRTGVDDIREIIENSHYLPTSARYKIFIIDEVHMLSKNAFNALLKTLEEPPAHVKFIFATTEIQKIPITILSRCQRFDLRRIQIGELVSHLQNIVAKEEANVSEDALKVIASASEGSVRDSLSMLDQAISQHEGEITAQEVRNMLGLADHTRIGTLFEAIAAGNTADTISQFNTLYYDGADPLHIIEELMEYNYLVTSIKVGSSKGEDAPEEQRTQAKVLAEKLSVAYLSSMWQMLLKGLNELRFAPSALIAGEMLMVRITHLSSLPTPAKLVESYQKQQKEDANGTVGKFTKEPSSNIHEAPANTNLTASQYNDRTPQKHAAMKTAQATQAAPTPQITPINTPAQQHHIASYEALVALFKERKEILCHEWLYSHCQLVHFEAGMLELNLSQDVPQNFTKKISDLLQEWTGTHWQIIASHKQGQQTLKDQHNHEKQQRIERISAHPEVAPWLEHFPGTKIVEV